MSSPIACDEFLGRRIAHREGSLHLLEAIQATKAARPLPAGDLIWRERFTPPQFVPSDADSPWKLDNRRQAEMAAAHNAEIEARRVNRDPCPRCNTRADIGCKHVRREV